MDPGAPEGAGDTLGTSLHTTVAFCGSLKDWAGGTELQTCGLSPQEAEAGLPGVQGLFGLQLSTRLAKAVHEVSEIE